MSRGILSWGDFVLGGILSRGILSGGFCPGGFCPGGFCPDTENGPVKASSPNQMPGIRARDVVKRDTRPFVFSTKSLSCRSINSGDPYTVASSQ